LAQARNLANLPFTFKHVAIMSDAHCGYGMPIGGVLATRGAIIPNAVGVDKKGATRARAGERGIIPGSQGSMSFIVVGKGNPESFSSCSHGAGRLMGRKQAQRTLDLEMEKKRLDDLGVIHGMRTKQDLDEATSAYKDINTVMANQDDLVEITTALNPLAVIKG
jgi:tRNA-splicing ligase RtcB